MTSTKVSTTESSIEIKTVYQNKDICKSISGYRWNPSKKVWYYPKTLEAAQTILERFPDCAADDLFQKLLSEEEHTEEVFEIENFSEVPNTKLPCWNHQRAAFWFAEKKRSVALFMDMGTGKSKVVIDILNNQEAGKVLIVCPLSVVGVWPREFGKHGTKNYQVLPLNSGSVKQKTEKAQKYLELGKIRNDPTVIVVNYESLWRAPFAEFVAAQKFDSVILDESHRIKAPGGKASRFLANLGKSIKHKMILTGTPMPHNPGDLYAQYRFLDPSVFGTSFMRFKNQYAVPINQYEVAWTRNTEELSKKMYSIAFRVTKDILDLPEAVHETRECELSPKTFKIYKELERDFFAEVDKGEITVNNALTKLLRLQQIANGFVKSDEGKIIQIDPAKQNLFSDIIEDIAKDEKIVVFSKFINDLEIIKDIGRSSGRKCGEISGRQKDLTADATFPDDLDLLAVQMQAGGVGIDLSKARFSIYFSVGFSLGDYEQSLARVHRPGQLHKVFYIHMLAQNTVDEKIYMALKNKKNIINSIVNREEI